MPATSIAHICLLSTDLARTAGFYCTVLGLRKRFSFLKKDGSEIGYYLAVNDSNFIEVFLRDAVPGSASSMSHLCLQVPSIGEIETIYRKRGVEISEKKLGCDGSWQAWLADPDGTSIELHEYTPSSSQFTGKDCTVDW